MRKADFIVHTIVFTSLTTMWLLYGKESLVLILSAQFIVGIFQFISSVLRTIRLRTLNRKTQLLLHLYWVLCLLYAAGFIIISNQNFDNDSLYYNYLLSAWLIAFYYHFITYKLAYPKFIKSHLDI